MRGKDYRGGHRLYDGDASGCVAVVMISHCGLVGTSSLDFFSSLAGSMGIKRGGLP